MAVVKCPRCGKRAEKPTGAVNRARKAGYTVYCSRRCSGMARRNGLSKVERRRRKAEYDERYREANRERLIAGKREYFKRTYDPEKAREWRRTRAFDHTAYCRRYYADPTRKAAKVEYDAQRRAVMEFGEYAECKRLLIALQKEIIKQVPDKYERAKARGYYDTQNERQRWRRQAATN